MKWMVAVGLVGAGVIHLLPTAGILGAAQLERLYGVRIADPDLLVMMRHRALLFTILGLFLIVAAFRRDWQVAAIVAGLASAGGFVAIAWLTGGYSPAIARVVTADLVAIALLCLAGIAAALR